MARLQDKLQDGGDWPGETIKAVRKLKEIVVSDNKQASCASFTASLGPRMPPNILPMNLIAAPATADARCFKFQNDCTESSSTGTGRRSETSMIRATGGACKSATITGRSLAISSATAP